MILKTFIYLFSICIFCTVAQCQTAGAISKIEFTTLTRGYKKQVFISRDSVIEIVDGRQEENGVVKRKLNIEEWDALIKGLENVILKEIPTLQSPTAQRTFDGARHSSIRITDADGKAWEHSFDNENPHEKLKPFMDGIVKIKRDDK